jgi:cytochrome b6-f complex iron-sulfur subunit
MSKSRKRRSHRPTNLDPENGEAQPQRTAPPEAGDATDQPKEAEISESRLQATNPDSASAVPRTEPAERHTAAASDPSRRKFFRFAWLGLGSLAVLEFAWVAVNFLRPRLTPEEEAGIVIAGPVERYEPGTVTAFQRGKFYLSRLADGGFLALSRACTHLGCTVPWVEEEGRFVCPCHASAYDERGEVVNSPAPRPLDLYPIRIENGVLKIDTSEPQKRLSFEAAQVTKA